MDEKWLKRGRKGQKRAEKKAKKPWNNVNSKRGGEEVGMGMKGGGTRRDKESRKESSRREVRKAKREVREAEKRSVR